MCKRVILFALLLVAASAISCSDREAEERTAKIEVETTIRKEQLRRDKVSEELAEKHGALKDWDKEMVCYTMQLQNLLVDRGRPIFFRGHLADVYRDRGQCYVRFSMGMGMGNSSTKTKPFEFEFPNPFDVSSTRRTMRTICFILKCDCDDASKIVSMSQSEEGNKEKKEDEQKQDLLSYYTYLVAAGCVALGEEYAVVAKVSNVERPTIRIGVHLREEPLDLDYDPSNTFVAVGDCIELVYMGGRYLMYRPNPCDSMPPVWEFL